MNKTQLQFASRKPSANRGSLGRRLFALVMSLLLVCSLPLAAFADTWYLEDGDITVNATESGQTVSQGETNKNDDAPVITQHDSSTSTTNTVTIKAEENATANVTIQDVNIVISDPTDNPQNHSGEAAVTIDVENGAAANVTLDGVNIDVGGTGKYANSSYSGEAAVQITGNGNVTLEMDGENTLQGGNNRAAVEKNTTDDSGKGELTITDENEIHGSLEATGGIFGAGIGGGKDNNGSNITITGSAEITAKGGDGGSGIGGGNLGSGSDITITGSAEVTSKGGQSGSGIGGGFLGSGSNITITGSAEVTAKGTDGGAGIGGGVDGAGSDITITGIAEVTAKGDNAGSGIGGGLTGTGSNITVSQNAQVKAQGGEACQWGDVWFYGEGAAIGDGGTEQKNAFPDPGAEVDPDIRKLTPSGRIEYYTPGADMETDAPYKIVTGTYGVSQPAEPVQTAPLYRVVGQDGKALACKAEQKGGVLTITVDADFATLTGSFSGLKTLKAQGVDTIVFVTNGATSTFAIADLLAQGGDSYQLTHDGETVTFTLSSGEDIGKILK